MTTPTPTLTPKTDAAEYLIYSGAKTDGQRLTEWRLAHAKLEMELTATKQQRDEWRECAEQLSQRLNITDNHLLYAVGHTEARDNNKAALHIYSELERKEKV